VIAYFYPKDLSETPAEPVPVCRPDELPIGEAKTVAFGRYPALVINTPSGLRAYSAVCTHFACLVKWDPAIGQIACPCHDGFFDPEDGSVLSGPPPLPLEAFHVYIADDGLIYVGAQEGEGA
jgi:Rieske Fe-S protein